MASRNTYQVAFALNSRLSSNFSRNFNVATQQINNIAKVAKTAASAMVAAFSFKKTIGTGITEAMNLEGFRMQLETATKSAEKAADIMNWSVKLANSTPFETGSVVEASARLEAMGLSAKKYVPMIGDMAGATNKDLIQATEAIIDAQAGELERLKEFGIKKSDIVEYAYNKMGKIQVVNNNGQITNQEKFNEAMLALMDDKFKGGMEKQAKTLKGVWSTVTGVTKTALANMVGITNEGTIKQGSLLDALKGSIGAVGDTLMKWQESGVFNRISEVVGSVVSKATSAIKGVSTYIMGIMPKLISVFKQVQVWGIGTFQKIKVKISENQPLLEKIKTVINEVSVFFSNLGQKGKESFESMKPTLEWLKNNGLPLIADGMMLIIEKALDVYNCIKDNWATLEPFILGISAALVTYKIAMGAVKTATLVQTGVTKGLVAVEKALAVAMNMSPMGKIAAIIGLVVFAGTLLYKNWDTIKVKATELWATMQSVFGNIGSWFQEKWNSVLQITQNIWNNISNFLGSFPMGQAFLQNITNMINASKQIFSGVIDFIKNVFTGNWKGAWQAVIDIFRGMFDMLTGFIKAPINAIIGIINTVIKSINSISLDIPEWVPSWAGGGKSIGFNIPEIPMFYKGSTGFNTPDTFIAGERGAELVTNAKGYRVFNNQQTKGIFNESGKTFGSELSSGGFSNNSKVEVNFNPQISVSGSSNSIADEILKELMKYEPILLKKILHAISVKAQNEKRLKYGG